MVGVTGMPQAVEHDAGEFRVFVLPLDELLADEDRLHRQTIEQAQQYTVSSGSVQSAKGGSPEFSTLYEFDVENSMFRPIDGFVQNGYNIIEIIIIQIILCKR